MKYLSVCSGIEAASVAWGELGWEAVAFSEVAPFPNAVLKHHFPDVTNLGDMTRFKEWPDATFNVLVGGTPCQSFSVFGLRKGLADPRGNLAITYLAIAARYRPAWVVWENVPGVLSDAGNAFGNFLAGLSELGYGWAYRILDAQYVRVESHPRAVPQRRRRVFVVGHLGDWRRAAAVLFERESLCGHPAPRKKKGERVAPSLAARTKGGGGLGTDFDCDGGLVAHALRAEGFDASEDGTGRGTPLIPTVCGTLSDGAHMGGDLTARMPIQAESSRCLNAGGMGRQDWETETFVLERTEGGFDAPIPFDTTQITSDKNYSRPQPGDPAHPLAAHAHAPVIAFSCKDHGADAGGIAVAFQERGREGGRSCESQVDVAYSLVVKNSMNVAASMRVRRLTPTECERLQGFPDGWTDVPYRGKPAADGPRYRAIGNSMAVNVMRWIGERIASVEAIKE